MQSFAYMYFIRFSLQLFFCEFLFVRQHDRQKHFWGRLIGGLTVYFTIGLGMQRLINLFNDYSTFLTAISFLVLFIMSIILFGFLFKMTFADSLFVGIGGYATQHLAYVGQSFVQLFWLSDLPLFWETLILKIVPYLLVGIPMYFWVIKPNINKGEQKPKDIKMIFLAVAVIIAVIFLSIYANYDGSNYHYNGYKSYNWIVSRLYGAITCLLALFIAFNLAMQNKLEHDNSVLDHLIQIKEKQQALYLENIDLINIKYHDLKHQFRKIIELEDREAQKDYFDEMNKIASVFESTYKTGNEALDVVLTEKSLLCDKYHIHLSCMVEGERLSFISTPDIYALFGNAFDNAIESLRKIEDIDKRSISMTTKVVNQMVYVHIENYCEQAPVFIDGLPKTSHSNQNFHGYGTRSIKYIANRYGGTASMKYHDHHFHVDLLFPMDDQN